jgi:hypothetical protein
MSQSIIQPRSVLQCSSSVMHCLCCDVADICSVAKWPQLTPFCAAPYPHEHNATCMCLPFYDCSPCTLTTRLSNDAAYFTGIQNLGLSGSEIMHYDHTIWQKLSNLRTCYLLNSIPCPNHFQMPFVPQQHTSHPTSLVQEAPCTVSNWSQLYTHRH